MLTPQETRGTWTARLQDGWTRPDGQRMVSINVQQGSNHQHGTSLPLAELRGLGANGNRWTSQGPVQFTVSRDAGDIRFEGAFVNGGGAGTYTFTPKPDYIAAMAQAGYRGLDDDTVMRLALQDVSRSFVASINAMKAVGYERVEVNDLVRMRIHGVTPQFITQMRDLGYGDLSADRLVQFRIHGVTPEFVREAKAAGFTSLNADDLVDLSIHGRRWMSKR